MLITSTWIWTHIAYSISNDNNLYAKQPARILMQDRDLWQHDYCMWLPPLPRARCYSMLIFMRSKAGLKSVLYFFFSTCFSKVNELSQLNFLPIAFREKRLIPFFLIGYRVKWNVNNIVLDLNSCRLFHFQGQ